MAAHVPISHILVKDGRGQQYNTEKITRINKSLLTFVFVVSIEFDFSRL
jgi:hypothetical protein